MLPFQININTTSPLIYNPYYVNRYQISKGVNPPVWEEYYLLDNSGESLLTNDEDAYLMSSYYYLGLYGDYILGSMITDLVFFVNGTAGPLTEYTLTNNDGLPLLTTDEDYFMIDNDHYLGILDNYTLGTLIYGLSLFVND